MFRGVARVNHVVPRSAERHEARRIATHCARDSVAHKTLEQLLIVAALAGLLAAQLPARRAAHLDILGALASE